MSVRGRYSRISVSQAVLIILSCAAAAVTLYPMYYVLIMSVSDPFEAIRGDVYFWPKGFYLGSYQVIVSDISMWKSAALSVFYVIAGTVLILITSVLAAYPLTKSNLKFRKPVVIFMVISMYFSGGLIPTFLLYYKLQLYNSIWSMILPGYGVWYIILVRTYFMTIPKELSDSAQIDGASNFQILGRIFLPLAKPVLAVIAIYSIVGIWNSWFNALIYLPNKELHPLQLYLQRVLIAQSVDLTKLEKYNDINSIIALVKKTLSAKQLKYAMIIFVSLPIIMVYPMFQKHFIKGVMLGSLKG